MGFRKSYIWNEVVANRHPIRICHGKLDRSSHRAYPNPGISKFRLLVVSAHGIRQVRVLVWGCSSQTSPSYTRRTSEAPPARRPDIHRRRILRVCLIRLVESLGSSTHSQNCHTDPAHGLLSTNRFVQKCVITQEHPKKHKDGCWNSIIG